MKTKSLTVVAIGTLLAITTLGSMAIASPGYGRGCDDQGEQREMRQEKRMELMAEMLGLSDTQQEQIRAIHEKERNDMAATREQMRDGREKMRALVEADSFDETAIRSLATSQAALKTELLVAKSRVRHEVFNLLNEEQQALMKKFEPLMRGKGKHQRGHKGF